LESRTASGLVPFDSASTITMQAVSGTARKAPAMPHSALHAARLARIANGLRLSEFDISQGSSTLPMVNWTARRMASRSSSSPENPNWRSPKPTGTKTPRNEPRYGM
jgi:hypothetical protein